LFFATDIHGSETCFRKFLNAGLAYKADVLIMGGDMTGKMLVPLVEAAGGEYTFEWLGAAYSLPAAELPHTARAAWETVWLPQPVLLGDERDMQSVVAAIQKIQQHAEELSIQAIGAK